VVHDAVGLTAIAVVVAVVHFVAPAALQQRLVFDHGQVHGYTLLTAAYVHASDVHLLQNLQGYLRIVGFPYVFSLLNHQRRWFWRTTLALLVVLPILTSITSYALIPVWYPNVTPITYGFSDIVAGFAGVLLVAVAKYTRTRHGSAAAWAVSIAGGLFVLSVIGARLAGMTVAAVTSSVLLAVGLTLIGGRYALQSDAHQFEDSRIELVQEGVILGVTGVVLGALLWDLFAPLPALHSSGPTTNLIAHAAGLTWGVILAAGLGAIDQR
jgi:hypothetical protein